MKKSLCYVLIALLSCTVFALSVNPSMDGRAVVADNGVFPPGGYYGRAPGYLPGDTVIVTNHTNGFSIDVLILGSYDAYEGIAILLSPEAAEKLQIIKGKDVYVKVQKKQPIPYEEAVATSRNKKITEKQAIDTDKDSSVLPGETEKLINDVVSSNKTVTETEDVIPYEDVESLDENTENPEIAENTEEVLSEVENPEVAILEEQDNDDKDELIPESESIITENPVAEEIPEESIELADIEEETELSENDIIVVENPEEETLEEVASTEDDMEVVSSEEVAKLEETPEEEIVLAEPEEFVESELINSPVFEEVAEVEPKPTEEIVEVVEPEFNENQVVLDEPQYEEYNAEDVIELPENTEVAENTEIPEEIPVENIEEIPETEIALEDVYLEEDFSDEEILIPEEELALEDEEPATEEEITEPEILDTDVLEDEPELAILDDSFGIDEAEKSVAESPKDIFSMIVGENPDEEILQDVVLEEADPKLPEADDLFDSMDNMVADIIIELEDSETTENTKEAEADPNTEIAQVAVAEKKESVVNNKTPVEADEFKNTVSNFNDLPKVKQVKSKTYYVQIATVSSKDYVNNIYDIHGKKYPVYVIKNPSSSMYQVLIGPLNDDEYALVLARFKQTYKDAFLRVLK
ncbi:MAG: SPOR domain-containing protein [Spirochaetaceae bacterium]|nr:SPOR domain-containing protein [Treponema sp.]MBP3449303.1 SPOR domain-containing protein [Spirochaetaceae bacterium]